MDDEQLLTAVAEILWPDLRDLACREHGHASDHVCLPVSARADLGNLVETLSSRYGEPCAGADRLPPLPLSGQVDWRYAWPFSNRWVAFGRTGQGEDAGPVLMIALRGTPVAEQLPAEASWLERLVAVTGWVPRAAGQVDWAAVESRLGTPLPSDYKALVETFGDGMFDGFHCVFMPDGLIKTTELMARLGQASWEPHPPFPASGGLVPWMGNEHEQSFCWITEGPDPDRWPVYVTEAEPEAGDRFDCTATEYLFRHLTDPQHPIPMPVDFRAHWFMDCSGSVESDAATEQRTQHREGVREPSRTRPA
ncbi:SMI1/KNR4 family protein [Streptomyces sp. M2CJ-2]|uniref:SMI1/KNR4 family protein n=1 Tax=Streptomyces sp. M2CJ-2 TaxID=2803948 RepID=UPI001926621F|nr:SMI1/KNR4 family protein [Streptomyces sp. M2CJ-2]MBL3668361.1 SMI1/KNR4 family protein [Streptomyces sp. M2CJ-2]